MIAPSESAARQVVELLEQSGLNVTAEAIVTGQLTFDALSRPPAIVLIDRGTSAADAAEAVERARRELLGARIVVIFAEGDSDPHRIFRAGADGMVVHSEAAATLAVTVQAVAAGQLAVPSALRDLVEPPTLTHREKQVLGLMADGLTNAQIGRRLYLAESTVKSHLSNAFKRLGVRSRQEASARLLAGDPALRQDLLAAIESARVDRHSGTPLRRDSAGPEAHSVERRPSREPSASGAS